VPCARLTVAQHGSAVAPSGHMHKNEGEDASPDLCCSYILCSCCSHLTNQQADCSL
jgi:hypothetical protein